MFRINIKSLNRKISVIISAILVITFAITISYYNVSLKKRINIESEQLLLNIGQQYENALSNEINKIQSIADVLSVNISYNYENNDFTSLISGTFKNIISTNSKIYNISLVTTESVKLSDSLLIKGGRTDSLYFYSISFTIGKEGIFKDNKLIKFNDIQNQILFSNSVKNNINTVLNPEFLPDRKFGLIPIIKPVYKGKRYIGYLRIFIETSWIEEIVEDEDFEDKLEIIIASNNGMILFINNQRYLLGKSLQSEFPIYSRLTNNIDSEYQTLSKGNILFLSKAIKFEKSKAQFSVSLLVKKKYILKNLAYNFWLDLSIGLSILILTIWLLIYFLDKTIEPLNGLIKLAKKVSIGDFENEHKDVVKRDDEIGQLQNAFQTINSSLKEVANVSNSIASGDFSQNVEVKSEKDALAKSINQMNDALKRAKEEGEKRIEEDEYSKWFSKGTTEINNVLKVHHKNINDLAQNVTQAIVKFFNIALGGIFIVQKDENEESYLELISAYAYADSKFIKRKFKIGESLVGSCASEKRVVYLSKLPRGYLKILSGLGKSSPKSLLLIPLVFDDEIMGVIELASLKEISKNEIKLIESMAESIANTLSIANTNINTQELLEKSQKYTHELALKDEAMKSTMTQLQELQEQTAKSEASVKTKLGAMNNTLMTVEYSTDGILIDANQKYLVTMNYSFEEIKGINVLELLKDEDKNELIRVIELVKKGNFYESIMRRHTKEGREKWLLATYTPLRNEHDEVKSILFYAVDITRIKQNESLVKEELESLKKKINKKS